MQVGDRAAEYHADEHLSRANDGNSYIYEELLQTEGTDVKVQAPLPRKEPHARPGKF